jgi:dihydroxyacetone kinase
MGANEVEIGLGTHNKSGHNHASPVLPLKELIPAILQMITFTIDKEWSFVPFNNDATNHVVLLVNDLRGLSERELGGVRCALGKFGIQIMCLLFGSFIEVQLVLVFIPELFVFRDACSVYNPCLFGLTITLY